MGNVGLPFEGIDYTAKATPFIGLTAGQGMLLAPAYGALFAFGMKSTTATGAHTAGPLTPTLSPQAGRGRAAQGSLTPQAGRGQPAGRSWSRVAPRHRATSPRVSTPIGVPSDTMTSYQVDAQHTGVQNDPLAPPLVARWSVNLNTNGISYPLIADGKVFLTATPACLSPPCPGSSLYALDQVDGHLDWGTIALGSTYNFAAATYDAGRVFVQNDNGLISAFDSLTGVMLWSKSYGTPPGAGTYESPPVARDGWLYVKAAVNGNGAFIKVSETDGSDPWWNSDGFTFHGAPATTSDMAFTATDNGGPTAISLADSTTRWSHAGGRLNTFSVSAAAGSVFTHKEQGTGYGYSWSASDGHLIAPFSTDAVGTIDATAGLGFFLSNGVVQAEDLSNNSVLWDFWGDNGIDAAPLVANGVVYTASSTGAVFAIDEFGGAQLWMGSAGAPVPAGNESQNVPLTGLGIGQGLLVVPTDSVVTAFEPAPPPPILQPRAWWRVPVHRVPVHPPKGAWYDVPVLPTPQAAAPGGAAAAASTPAASSAGPPLTEHLAVQVMTAGAQAILDRLRTMFRSRS